MAARRSVWSDSKVIELASEFIPVADEVGRLQRADDAECRWFRKVAEQGHFAGRTEPTGTRQGIYAVAPSGALLASINSTNRRRVAGMLRRALAKWKNMPPEKRRMSRELPAAPQKSRGWMKHFYPTGGLVLKMTTRDLPRKRRSYDWRERAWNMDYAWIRKEEARRFLSARPAVGDKHELPADIIRRIARCHLVDNVRGQTKSYADADVQSANLTSEVVAIEDGRVSLRLVGAARLAAEGVWAIHGFYDAADPKQQSRGYDAKLYGKAEYDLEAERFVAFELVAIGDRWGGTQYNSRGRDLEPAPMGVLFSLAGDTPAERMPPAAFWDYGWHK